MERPAGDGPVEPADIAPGRLHPRVAAGRDAQEVLAQGRFGELALPDEEGAPIAVQLAKPEQLGQQPPIAAGLLVARRGVAVATEPVRSPDEIDDADLARTEVPLDLVPVAVPGQDHSPDHVLPVPGPDRLVAVRVGGTATVEAEQRSHDPIDQRGLAAAVGPRDDQGPGDVGERPAVVMTAIDEGGLLDAGTQHHSTSSARSAARRARWAISRSRPSAASRIRRRPSRTT